MLKQTFSKEPRLGMYEEKIEQYSITYTDDATNRTKTLGFFTSEDACLDAFDSLITSLKRIRTLQISDTKATDNIHVSGTGYIIDNKQANDGGKPHRTPVEFAGVLNCVCRDTISNRLNKKMINALFGVSVK
jgi:hypothetical protein